MQLSTLLPLIPLFLSFSSALTIPHLHSRAAALGSLGGAAPPVTNSGDPKRPFEVNGNTFVNQSAAQQRSCDIQNNACFDAVNAGGAAFTQADCQAQQQACNSATSSTTTSSSGASASGSGSAAGAGTGAGATATASSPVASVTASAAAGTGADGTDDSCPPE